jgi:hypothetical protein
MCWALLDIFPVLSKSSLLLSREESKTGELRTFNCCLITFSNRLLTRGIKMHITYLLKVRIEV